MKGAGDAPPAKRRFKSMQKIVSNDATAPVCENEKGIDFFASNPPNVLNLQYLALNAQNVMLF